jgi:hypothetical protein
MLIEEVSNISMHSKESIEENRKSEVYVLKQAGLNNMSVLENMG